LRTVAPDVLLVVKLLVGREVEVVGVSVEVVGVSVEVVGVLVVVVEDEPLVLTK